LIAAACGGDDGLTDSTTAATTPSPTVESSDQPAESVDAAPPDGSSAPSAGSVMFEPCGAGLDCAMVDVPLDYVAPDGESVGIHVTRHVATGERVGTLFVNPGGPGFGAEEMVGGLGQFGPPPLTEAFDLVGIDPRGTGKSGEIDCNADDEADAARRLSYEPEDVDAFIADFVDLAETCEQKYGAEYLASLTTENAARDIESVRIALGDEPLSYYGASYGTAIGSVYATLFPDSVRAMVLDAAVPTDPGDGTYETLAAGYEDALVKLDTSCGLWEDCPLHNEGLLSTIDDVRQTLEDEGTIGSLDAATFNAAVGALFGHPDGLLDVAAGLAAAAAGNGSMLAQIGADQQATLVAGDGLVQYSGSKQAIVCADGWKMQNSTADQLAGQAARTAALAPNAGPGWETPCDLWPVTGPGIPGVDYTGSAPILVIGAEGDPITPLAWAEQLAADLGPNGTLLTFGGGGHVTAFRTPGCIDDHVFGLLLELVSPPADARCEEFGLVGLGYPDSPVIVDRVTTGSPAEGAGVQIGDEILEANGEPVSDYRDVPRGVIGDTLELVVDRDGERIEFTIVRGPAFWEYWRLAEAVDQ
jgi:pimeloyl-ACP methyl ester carboxylesterase